MGIDRHSYYLNNSFRIKKEQKPFTSWLAIGVFFTIILVIIFLKFRFFGKKTNSFASPVSLFTPIIKEEIKNDLKPNNLTLTSLIDNLQKEISSFSGTYCIYLYDLHTDQGFGLNEEMILMAASVNKIPILAALYYEIENGTIDPEKIIVPQEKDIRHYGTGSIQYDPKNTPYSIKTLARLMMEKSDNTAAYLFGTHILGLDNIQKLIEGWGLTQTNMVKNTTSVKDMGILLTKMYRKEIVNPALTAEMMGLMAKSDFDDRLPLGLPEGIKIYHKTGDEVRKVHDVGIIDLPGKPYFLGILTTDVTEVETAKKNIASLSKTIYEFMSSLRR